MRCASSSSASTATRSISVNLATGGWSRRSITVGAGPFAASGVRPVLIRSTSRCQRPARAARRRRRSPALQHCRTAGPRTSRCRSTASPTSRASRTRSCRSSTSTITGAARRPFETVVYTLGHPRPSPRGTSERRSACRWIADPRRRGPRSPAPFSVSFAASSRWGPRRAARRRRSTAPSARFEAAKYIDVVCMRTLSGEDAGGIPAVPLSQANCTPVPAGVVGAILPNHLFALVTQTLRGEVAVVDLTAGVIIDEDLGSPGVNFLPVGQQPSGIASAPDGKMTYVASADINMPAIYALPSTMILGDSQQLEGGVGRTATPATLTSWPVCALPQTPATITIIPRAPLVPILDADGRRRARTLAAPTLAATAGLGRWRRRRRRPRRGTCSPSARPERELAGLAARHRRPRAAPARRRRAADPPPVTLRWFCRARSYRATSSARFLSRGRCAMRARARPGRMGSRTSLRRRTPLCRPPPPVQGIVDAGVDATATPVPPLPNPAPIAASAARAGQFLYVTDAALPIIHVFDLFAPKAPRELAPLRATSLAQPRRQVVLGALAVSPPTRNYQRFLYAVDMSDNPSSIIVYDVTDPLLSPHVPLRRPHSALNPLEPEDRINFNGPVVAVAFVQHDWPLALTPTGANTSGAAGTGLLCNPNPNVDGDAAADASARRAALHRPRRELPQQLRRVRRRAPRADAPSRHLRLRDALERAGHDHRRRRLGRPVPSARVHGAGAGDDARSDHRQSRAPNAAADGGALDPYEAPDTGVTNGVSWVSDEVFFPVSSPHRARSEFPLRNDPTLGIHYPYLVIAPQLYAARARRRPRRRHQRERHGREPGPPADRDDAGRSIRALPDGGVGIRIGWEDPTAHVDQNWSVDYEGSSRPSRASPGRHGGGRLPGAGAPDASGPERPAVRVGVPEPARRRVLQQGGRGLGRSGKQRGGVREAERRGGSRPAAEPRTSTSGSATTCRWPTTCCPPPTHTSRATRQRTTRTTAGSTSTARRTAPR